MLHQVVIRRHVSISLGMSDDRNPSALDNVAKCGHAVRRNTHEWKFDQNERCSGEAHSRIGEIGRGNVEHDLHSPLEAHLRKLLGGKSLESSPRFFHCSEKRIELMRVIDHRRAKMRRGNYVDDALSAKRCKPEPRLLESCRAVVDTGHEMIVKIKHSGGIYSGRS